MVVGLDTEDVGGKLDLPAGVDVEIKL